MVARHPTIPMLAKVESKVGLEDPPFQDNTRHVVLPGHGRTRADLDLYVRAVTTIRASLISGKEDANTLLMEVATRLGQHHVLVAHAPQSKIGVEPYVRWWAGVWREVTCIVDATNVLVVIDINSAARPADRGYVHSVPRGYGLPHVPKGLQPQGPGGSTPSPAYRAFVVEPFHFPGLMWEDDRIILLERGDARGSCWISGRTTRVSCGLMSRKAKSSTGRRRTPSSYGRPRQQPWPAKRAARG